MEVKLVMFKANGQRREYPLKAHRTTLGRSPDCLLQIPLAIISRKHCQLTMESEKLLVRDMGSTNGTFVNDKRVQQVPLSAGDVLRIGPVIFTVVIDGEPAQIRPVRTVIVENAVEPIAEKDGGEGTLDVEAEETQPVPEDTGS